MGHLYNAAEILQVQAYANVQRWAQDIAAPPALPRGGVVNRNWGGAEEQLHNRHDALDFDTRTQDKLSRAAG